MLLGKCLISHWCNTQSNIALSSGEAELNATVKGLSEGLGIWQLIQELWTNEALINLKVDSSACRGMLLRHGSGRVKHLSTKQLWVQEAVRSFGIDVQKVPRETNVADALTHETSSQGMLKMLRSIGSELR